MLHFRVSCNAVEFKKASKFVFQPWLNLTVMPPNPLLSLTLPSLAIQSSGFHRGEGQAPVPDVSCCVQCRCMKGVLSLLSCSMVAPRSPEKISTKVTLQVNHCTVSRNKKLVKKYTFQIILRRLVSEDTLVKAKRYICQK